jgi:hypothetical protein
LRREILQGAGHILIIRENHYQKSVPETAPLGHGDLWQANNKKLWR